MTRSGPSRRELLAGLAFGLAYCARPRSFRSTARGDARAAVAPPRYWINIVPTGGVDAIYTTDPRTRSDVADGIDVPYERRAIIEAGKLRLGPHLAPLAPLASRFTIVNGIVTRSANHYTGIEQITRLRTNTTMRTPAAFDIIGAHRDGQAMAHVTLGAVFRQAQTPDFFGTSVLGDFGGKTTLFDWVDQLGPDELRQLARAVDDRIRPWRGRRAISDEDAKVVDSMEQVQRYFARCAEVPRFDKRAWLSGPFAGHDDDNDMARGLQRALWLIENDLAATVTVFLGRASWDTHTQNASFQGAQTPVLAASLAQLLTELEQRTTARGTLAEQTAVIVGSEIGRFPYLNQMRGKDHLPQIGSLFAGPAFVRGRQFGATGRQLESLPVSAASGAHDPTADELALDDVGYTALRAAAINPEIYGVGGRDLAFLRARS